jgi:hypothetical protein
MEVRFLPHPPKKTEEENKMMKLLATFVLAFVLVAGSGTSYITENVAGNTVTLKNVSTKTISEMGGDLLESGVIVGVYKHTFATGMTPGMSEPMTVDGATSPSITVNYINFKDGTSWKATSTPSAQLDGQTLTLDRSNSYCKKNTFTTGYSLHGTWRNTTTGCVATGDVVKQVPYSCAVDPNYGYPDLAHKSCKAGICCTIQYTALRPTVAADSDCLSTGNGFYTGILGEQQ